MKKRNFVYRLVGLSRINSLWDKEFNSNSLEKNKDLDALDSGMGYESVYAVLVTVEEVEVIEVDEKKYKRSDWKQVLLGDCTDEELEFLKSL